MPERTPITRPNYFAGEALLTEDFVCEQQYHMDMLAQLNRGLHTYGIATGLQVYWQTGSQSRQVRVSEGMAIDGLGREIVLTEPQVVVMDEAQAGAMYFLTITYYDSYADLSDSGGVAGFKRIVQQPKLSYVRTLGEPELNILLAVVNFSSQGTINSLTYQSGKYERRYVAGRFGAIDLVTEGSGIGSSLLPLSRKAALPLSTVSLHARRETDGSGDYLDVSAARAQYDGQVTTRGNLGIGMDHPQANLQIASITFEGPGTLTSDGPLLTLSDPIYPPLQPGDAIIPTFPLSATPSLPKIARVAAATSNPCQYQMDATFNPALSTPYPYSYVRWTLARFATPLGLDLSQSVDLLRIDRDGTVNLGVPSQPKASADQGVNALTITADRRVGIGLTGSFQSQARLEVAGQIQADNLTVTGQAETGPLRVIGQILADGAIKAQSFEGNGAKLQNLPILSYWTKQNVAAANSALYYDTGNVGIQMTTPAASLGVGSGKAFVGSGTVTLIADTSKTPATYTLKGFQTQFTTEVNSGDTIVVGILDQMHCQITQIINDTEVILDQQFPILVENSPYLTLLAGQSEAAAGKGTITSNGTQILGTGTQFSKDTKPGDLLCIERFIPIDNGEISCRVQAVADNATLTLVPSDAMAMGKFTANLSAYMVRPCLIGQFVDNSGMVDAQNATALLVIANGPQPTPGTTPFNTVAVNMPLADVDPDYALQVNGPTNFSGSAHFDALDVTTLTVNQQAIIGSSATPTGSPALHVSTGNLTADANVVAAGTVSGNAITATTSVSAAQMTASGAVSAAQMTASGTVTAALLAASALQVPGLQTNAQGNVTLLGASTRYNQDSMNKQDTKDEYIRTFNQNTPAPTDGFVIGSLGTFSQSPPLYAGALQANTSGGTTMFTTAASFPYTVHSDKKGGDVKVNVPLFGTLCLPVHKGETWSLMLTGSTYASLPNLTFYWFPLGAPTTKSLQEQAPPENADDNHESGLAAMRAGMPRYSLETAQQAIQSRVGDLTRVLGDATRMSADPQDRNAFMTQLMNIVCKAAPPGTPTDNTVADGHIDSLVDTFAHATGKSFSQEDRDKLDQAVRALVEINASDENRHNLDLIMRNISLFLGNIQSVNGQNFSAAQTRLLTRALSRLVGDGSHALPNGAVPS